MATSSASAGPAVLDTSRAQVAQRAQPIVPIKAWAVVGALFATFILFVMAKWLTGPFATPVETGPSEPPTWMSVNLIVWQVVMTTSMFGFFYWFLIRPWMRQRVIATDGLICVAGLFLWFQDPLSNYFTPWITYNSELANIGSWVNEVPGWMSFGEPGRQVLEPYLLEPGVYVCLWLAVAALGCAIMRKAKVRWPHFGPYRLLGICFLSLAIFDAVLEGLIMMPLGLFTYIGGPFPILFPDRYHVFPLHEPICASLMFTGVAGLRYFKDDKGRTLVERGVDRVQGTYRKGFYRLLAIIAWTQLCFLIGYTLPVTLVVTAHPREWPADAQERSYFTNFLCGDGTNRACPGPDIPLSRQSQSARVTPQGELFVPAGTELPALVPFDRGKPGDGD